MQQQQYKTTHTNNKQQQQQQRDEQQHQDDNNKKHSVPNLNGDANKQKRKHTFLFSQCGYQIVAIGSQVPHSF